MELPVREVKTMHRCLCVLLHRRYQVDPTTGLGTLNQVRDECIGWSDIPDSPLCGACIAAHHDIQDHVPYTEVQASRREVRET